MPAARNNDVAIVELLREDPEFANEYLNTALNEADEPGGREALLAALRQVAQAQGMEQASAAFDASKQPAHLHTVK